MSDLVPAYQSYPEPVLAQIGDIQVTPTMVRTPMGEFPLQGSNWVVTDQSMVTQATPTWAIVMAIVGFFCLTFFSLLFLLAKENRYSGMVQVFVSNGPRTWTARIPVQNQMHVGQIYNQVNYVRAMSVGTPGGFEG